MSDDLPSWVRRALIEMMKNANSTHRSFIIAIPPPQKVNICPKDCPLFRDKGCIGTICILKRPYLKLQAPPVKEKESEE